MFSFQSLALTSASIIPEFGVSTFVREEERHYEMQEPPRKLQQSPTVLQSLTVHNNCKSVISHFKALLMSGYSMLGSVRSSTIAAGQSVTLSAPSGADSIYFFGHFLEYDASEIWHVNQVAISSEMSNWGVTWNLPWGRQSYPYYKLGLDDSYTVNLCTKSVITSEDEALATCHGDAFCLAWLNAHNTRRMAYYTSHDKTPSLFVWNATLAAEAQAWADVWSDGGDTVCTYAHDANRNSGENLASNWAFPLKNAVARTPEEVLQAWWDTEYNMTQENNFSKANFDAVKHFTQAAYYNTQQLGCGSIEKDYTVQTENGPMAGKCFVQVCRYLGSQCNPSFFNWESDVLTMYAC
mmetsp:Transcript_26552/g.50133  ORF Transcript_26552/g.50133 Transcript_26552/m.50133 type:complete len:352 (+) Transcript_26552:258-1313(+)